MFYFFKCMDFKFHYPSPPLTPGRFTYTFFLSVKCKLIAASYFKWGGWCWQKSLNSHGRRKKATALINTESPRDSYPMWAIIFSPSLPRRFSRISHDLLFKMSTCCHGVPHPYRKSTLVVFWRLPYTWYFPFQLSKPFGIFQDKAIS